MLITDKKKRKPIFWSADRAWVLLCRLSLTTPFSFATSTAAKRVTKTYFQHQLHKNPA
ncbi:hypothetical protein ACFOSS_10110 [Pseudaeromonas sharmana]|uniref:Uncharacterized protein n=1 Tax=Pseudaeromonas sharmana TaxID=328412 RepID=A0ABV8CPK7_9GAMM